MERKNWILMVSMLAIMANTAVFGMEEEEEEEYPSFTRPLQNPPQENVDRENEKMDLSFPTYFPSLSEKEEGEKEDSPMNEVCLEFQVDQDVNGILEYLEKNGAFETDIMTGMPLIIHHISSSHLVPPTYTSPLPEENRDFFCQSVKALCTAYLREQAPGKSLSDMIHMLISDFQMYGLYSGENVSTVKNRLRANLSIFKLADDHWSLGSDSGLRDALDANPHVFRFGEEQWSLGISKDMSPEKKEAFQAVWAEILEAEPILTVPLGNLISRFSNGMDENQKQTLTSIFYYRAINQEKEDQEYREWFTLIEKYAPRNETSPQQRLDWLQERATYINEQGGFNKH